MFISVIVPIYYGKKYISDIFEMMKENLHYSTLHFELELIFINDSPDEDIREEELAVYKGIHLVLIINEENKGIHYSRLRGLEAARGKYILFLDQDDRIENNYFESQLRHIGNADVVVANGIAQYPAYEKFLYRYAFMQWTIKHIWFYVKFSTRIISPGQCLIRRDSIPRVWKENIIRHNGADDYFLWLVMLSKNCRFAINRDRLYTHVYTALNTSADSQKMQASVREVLQNLEGIVKERNIRLINAQLSEAEVSGAKKILVNLIEKINQKA